MARRSPPHFVPTLTEVVQSAPAPLAPDGPPPPTLTEEELARRVLQRIERTLDARVQEAVAALVLEHARALAPLLRERVESAVREAVAEALAEELQARQRDGGTNV